MNQNTQPSTNNAVTPSEKPMGMRAFAIIWLGQFVSLLGTGMTQFAITIYAWQITGKATALALMGFFAFGPTVLLSPVAGAIVDRANRKLVMMLSDLVSALMTGIILLLYLIGELQIWHLYIAGALSGAFQAFQFPAYSASVTMMLPKKEYARASGMLSLAGSASGIVAPILAGVLIALIGIGGIMTIDLLTFGVAILTLVIVHIPQPQETEAGREGRGNLWQESLFGFRYILARPSLLGLQLVFFTINLIATLSFTLLAPMVLARTGNNELTLGSVQSAMGIGGVAGGLLLSVWGGFKRRVHGVLGGMALSSLLGSTLIGLGRSLPLWAAGAFFASFFIPIVNGSNQAIWQAKVAPDVQGRVFAVRRLIAQITAPLAMLIAGPMADQLFEPFMSSGSTLAQKVSGLVGTGPGTGMSLLFVLTGLAGTLAGLMGYLFPVVRQAEELLPDHELAAETV
jgi:DHA3 family macrolide efflux protein-like MFS transporter